MWKEAVQNKIKTVGKVRNIGSNFCQTLYLFLILQYIAEVPAEMTARRQHSPLAIAVIILTFVIFCVQTIVAAIFVSQAGVDLGECRTESLKSYHQH